MTTNYDGIYLAYFTAEFGTSLGMFVFKDGAVTGADIGGARYSGKLTLSDDGKFLSGEIGISMSEGGQTITGAVSDLPVSYETSVTLALPLEDQPFHSIPTRTGTVNVRFERTVDL